MQVFVEEDEDLCRNMGIHFKNLLYSSTFCYMFQLYHATLTHQTTPLFYLSFSPPLYCYMKELLVNLDPVVLEVLYETKYLKKMHFEVPDVVLGLCADEEQIKRHQME